MINIKKVINDYKWHSLRNNDYISHGRPIVIGGCGRSGTTLFRLMLDSHPDVCIGPESSLFVKDKGNFPFYFSKAPDWETISKKFEISIDTINDLFAEVQSQAEFINKFFEIYKKKFGKKCWGDKSPRNIRHIDFIFKHFPQSRFIHIIRDGRDVACSLRTHPKHKNINGKVVKLDTQNPIESCINRWIKDVRCGLQWRGDSRYLEIKYEDLIHIPESTLLRVCNFLKISFDNKMLEHHKIDGISRDTSKFIQNRDAMSPVTSKSVNRWKKDLSKDEIELFKIEAGELLIDLKYAEDYNW